jgi:epoxyqueuosine reductase
MPPLPSANLPLSIVASIKAEAAELGFDLCFIIPPLPPPHYAVFEKWLGEGLHAGMAYLDSDRSRALRKDPTLLDPACQSIIVVAASYPMPETDKNPAHGIIASYALAKDYHIILPAKLEELCQTIARLVGVPIKTAAYTDSAPILERDLASRAGLGWVGKNACLISPNMGSFFFLAELFIDLRLESNAQPVEDHCGTCMRCIQACPTGCIRPDRTIDSNRCIAYHTIENKGIIPLGLRPLIGNRVFGCDICQSVCPWNKKAHKGTAFFSPFMRPDLASPDLVAELALDTLAFKQKYHDTPIMRTKRRGFLRNICIALGNSGLDSTIPALAHCLENESEPIIRAHAAWALGMFRSRQSAITLQKALDIEMDPVVKFEIELAHALST